MAIVTGRKHQWRVWALHAALWALLALTLFPLLAVISISLRPGNFATGSLIPSEISLEHWKLALGIPTVDAQGNLVQPPFPVLLWLWNSVKIAFVSAALIVTLSATAAYAFARMRFAHKGLILNSMLVLQMFPVAVALVAIYAIFEGIGRTIPWLGVETHAGLIVAYLGGVATHIWTIKGYYDTVPAEIEESAKVDGATPWQAFRHVLLPMAVPILMVVFVLAFIGVIIEYPVASILLREEPNLTLAVGSKFFLYDQRYLWGDFAAAAVLSGLPITLVFLLAQRWIVSGLTAGGVKGMMRRMFAAVLLQAPLVAAATDCAPHPLGGRDLYLRGSFNSWNAADAQRFVWACDRFELVTRLQGEHRFKVADEGWSADADLGGAPGALVARGAEMQQRFDGSYRFTLDAARTRLRVEACPAPAPFGDTLLFLRGTMNNWGALDDFALQYHCDAYYLNIRLQGRHEFKIADAAWSPRTSFGIDKGNHVATFTGEHTLRLSFDAQGRHHVDVGPRRFADPQAAAVDDPVALGLRFDSRDPAHKAPFGAQPAGTAFDFAVTAPAGVDALTLVVERRRHEGNQEVLEYTEAARVTMHRVEQGQGQRWTARHRFDSVGIWGYWFEARIGAKTFALQNNGDSIFWTREKGSGGRASVAALPASPRSIRRFRQTVYAPDFRVPDWAADAVYYYVFPERFRNGDTTNDPVPGRDRSHRGTVEKHPNWLDRPFRPGSGDGSDDRFNNDFFGGDLQGLIDRLDHIQALGANVIYSTPIFQAASNHKYDTADYHRIDPAFGTNEDFTRLTREAGRRGIRVVVDTSLNHTGADSRYFDRYGHFGGQGAYSGSVIRPGSPYASWYRFDPTQTDPDKRFTGWVGVTDLPELDKASPAWRDFAYRAPDSVTKRWLDAGAAGWRMDVAPWVPDDFWREWRAALKAHRPDAITIAETWFDAAKYFLGDTFDSTMNYIFRNTALAYAAGGDARELVGNLELMREHYPPQALHALMNLLSSHDQARSLHVLGWHDDADAAQAREAKARYRVALLLQMTWPGAPAVYYGDEVGLGGGDDPDNRRPFPWADLGGRPDEAMHAEFKRLIALRHALPVLRRGELGAPLHVDPHVMAWPRRLDDSFAVTATNNAVEPRTVTLTLPAGSPRVFEDRLDGSRHEAVDGRLTVTLPARWGRVLVASAGSQRP